MIERAGSISSSTSSIVAVAFDAFGTLVEYPVRLHPYRRLVRTDEKSTGDPALRREIFTSMRTPQSLARVFGVDVQVPDMLDELAREVAAMRLYADVLPTLALLRAAGYRVGLCSNLAQAYGGILRQLLSGHVDAMVLSFEVGFVKPEPEIFAHLCARLQSTPGATLFIGDSVASDVDGAERAGLVGRLIRRDLG